MKKVIISLSLIFVLLLSGCDEVNNTPIKQVESMFNKYQTLDQDVLDDLDRIISEEMVFDTTARGEYRKLIKEQYQNLTYKIKDEVIDGDNATVTVEITVTDYSRVLAEAETYKNSHLSEFQDELGVYQSTKYSNYVISQLKDAKEKVKYTVEVRLTKIDYKWKINGIDEDTEDKILGIYEY